jgi:poly-gamma-glutamate synthesis protein (capsule biosynthesis protein)
MTLKDYMKFAHPINRSILAIVLYRKLHISVISACLLLLTMVLMVSCALLPGTDQPLPSATFPPSDTAVPPTSTSIPTATLISSSPPFQAYIDPSISQFLTGLIQEYDFLSTTEDPNTSELIFAIDQGAKAGSLIYLAVAPFYTYTEDISAADLQACWESGQSDPPVFSSIITHTITANAFEHLWGPANDSCVEVLNDIDLTQRLWLEQDSIALIPFELVDPSYRILSVDGIDPLSKTFDPVQYPLSLHFNYQIREGFDLSLDSYPKLTNYDPGKLTSVALTGVTALVRDTANIMELEGVTYPAGDIQEILRGADITHINNEVPFAKDCPPPESFQESLRFCSDDRYIELLEAVGSDIIELSGDHFGDWGPEAMLHTLDLYDQMGWVTYGGGANLTEGLAPVLLTHNNNQLAFIGCNGKGIDKYATASEENPGAAQCDFKWMTAEISRLTSEGYLVIATMQHEEVDSFGSIALQQYDFRRLAEAGAVIVSGSQSHHPQAIEYLNASFIHYGLGNLFFDQYFLANFNPKLHQNKDKSFIDLHYFYDRRYIGTRLIPLQFIDNARPRPMNPVEKAEFLDEFYKHSLWNEEWIYLYSTGYMYNRMTQ